VRLLLTTLVAASLLPADASAGAFARFVSPTDGSRLRGSVIFQWTAAEHATSYQLWVGTTPGASDLLQTKESLALKYVARQLPAGVVLYARVWTRAGSTRRYDDARFAIAAHRDTVLFNAATGALRLQASIGTRAAAFDVAASSRVAVADFNGDGLSDIVSYTPETGAAHLRMNAGDGSFRDRAYTWARGWELTLGDLNGDRRADVLLYNATTGAYLEALSTAGGEFAYTSGVWAPDRRLLVADFNGDGCDDVLLYGRKRPVTDPEAWRVALSDRNGVFSYEDGMPPPGGPWEVLPGEFNGDRRSDLFLYSAASGQWFLATNTGGEFTYRGGRWPGGWRVQVADLTGDGLDDVLRYDPTSGRWIEAVTDRTRPFTYYSGFWSRGWSVTSARSDADAKSDVLLYNAVSGRCARVVPRRPGSLALHYGRWASGYSTVIAPLAPLIRSEATLVTPSPGGSHRAADVFSWTEPPLARAYRLQIGTTVGAHNLHDSGPIVVSRRFVRGLPKGVTLHARLSTETASGWTARDFTFTTASGGPESDVTAELDASMELMAAVRAMASPLNAPFAWTPLFKHAVSHDAWVATCWDYARVLNTLLQQLNTGLASQVFNVAFNPNGFDTHTLVEVRDPRDSRWILLDPTFAMTVRRAADGSLATAAEVSKATRARRWSALQFVPRTPMGLTTARSYYLDYPLLFLNVLDGANVSPDVASAKPYLEPVGASVARHGVYAVASSISPRKLLVGGTLRSMSTSGVDRLTPLFWADSVAPLPEDDPSFVIYRPRRYVF
jgi:hypothetical protein